ncbi:unnamed protein product [Fusarium equiseti]|uniref:Uncharacterized protein n=1 Tax=Fusarium equiseti TaxID=61235 RepID=A0A8J2IGH5_FUSEQ|nr:unnamed protein product [Fusarium equiseti]
MESPGIQRPLLIAPERAVVKRFYPPLLLLIALTSLCPRRRPGEDPEFDTLTGLEPLFRAFVSKIAFLCCTEVGGAAISACAVLQLPDCVQYVIGINEQGPARCEDIQASITSILHMFSVVPPPHSPEREGLRIRALYASLELCKKRVNGYMRSLKVHLRECIESCERESTQEGELTKNELSHILGLLEACLDTCHSEKVGLMETVATIWPQLFSDIQICMIKSSSPVSDVLPTNPWTAAKIMNRMSSDESLLHLFATQLDSLSVHDIDNKVSELWSHAPKPVVHAEVLLHDWLENTEGGIRPERFFNRWKFIGSSKPPCKLCSYFFDEYPTDVQVRPSHQNAYFAWRMPDVYTHQGKQSTHKRKLVMESIKTRIRADVVRMLSEKLADGRPHDSSAYISLWRGTASGPRDDTASLEETAQLLESCTVATIQEQGATDQESAEGVVKVLDGYHEEEILFKGKTAVRKTVQNRQEEQ